MSDRRLGIVMNGVTGRMGRNQHLIASVVAMRDSGGLILADGSRVVPEPLLVGRDPEKLKEVAAQARVERWTTDLDMALSDPTCSIYFDTVSPRARTDNLRRALRAGKHVHTEKPMALSLVEALELRALAAEKGVKHSVVSDKLWAPGFAKLIELGRRGFFGRVLMVRIDGCHWAFEGDREPLQRPSWNFKKAEGGGMIFDMLPHYAYLLEAVGGFPLDVVCQADTMIGRRWDEEGRPYDVDVEDTCTAMSRMPSGAMAQILCSWAVRVRRDDVMVMQVDGTAGSAVAGLTHCWVQPRERTTRAHWSRDSEPLDYYRDWDRLPNEGPHPNPYRVQWEHFLRHVADDAAYPFDFDAGLRTVRFAEGCRTSWHERRWVDLSPGQGERG